MRLPSQLDRIRAANIMKNLTLNLPAELVDDIQNIVVGEAYRR